MIDQEPDAELLEKARVFVARSNLDGQRPIAIDYWTNGKPSAMLKDAFPWELAKKPEGRIGLEVDTDLILSRRMWFCGSGTYYYKPMDYIAGGYDSNSTTVFGHLCPGGIVELPDQGFVMPRDSAFPGIRLIVPESVEDLRKFAEKTFCLPFSVDAVREYSTTREFIDLHKQKI